MEAGRPIGTVQVRDDEGGRGSEWGCGTKKTALSCWAASPPPCTASCNQFRAYMSFVTLLVLTHLCNCQSFREKPVLSSGGFGTGIHVTEVKCLFSFNRHNSGDIVMLLTLASGWKKWYKVHPCMSFMSRVIKGNLERLSRKGFDYSLDPRYTNHLCFNNHPSSGGCSGSQWWEYGEGCCWGCYHTPWLWSGENGPGQKQAFRRVVEKARVETAV